jgi:hypothetical protein
MGGTGAFGDQRCGPDIKGESTTGDGPVRNIAKYLIPVSWTLWGLLFLALAWGFVQTLVEPYDSPEVSPVVGTLVVGSLLVAFIGVGFLLLWATRRRSTAGLIALTLLLAYPVVLGIVSTLVRIWDTWQFERELSWVGEFPDPASQALGESIESGDIAGLEQLLAGGPPPTVRDRAGNDLLAFAALIVRDRDGDPETVRVLLESGADPQESTTPDGGSLLHFMVLDRTPRSIEVVRLLLEHGADPNAKDPRLGTTPMADAGAAPELVRLLVEAGADIDQTLPGGESVLVRFISRQQWDSALFLIERDANLDVTNPDGLSVDYYLNEFRDSVYGEHPEGWDRVRAAIRARRR